jgi:uncharacterized protein (TIGR04255 family)
LRFVKVVTTICRSVPIDRGLMENTVCGKVSQIPMEGKMTDEEIKIDRTLKNNSIKNFVLRIDLIPDASFDSDVVINHIINDFDRREKKIINGVKIGFSSDGKPTMEQTVDHEDVLVSDSRKVSLTFSRPQSAFWLGSTFYNDNSIYKKLLQQIQDVVNNRFPNTIAKRIGMRYVNEFTCQSTKEISRIFKTEKASIVRGLLKDNYLSRALAYQEYNCDGRKARVQYGVVNKFYPSLITIYDLILDIDAYYDMPITQNEWVSKVSELNHTAYGFFVEVMNDQYLERLR